jgi:hypothetical protein
MTENEKNEKVARALVEIELRRFAHAVMNIKNIWRDANDGEYRAVITQYGKRIDVVVTVESITYPSKGA